jgi:Transglutaminase-like superfamily
VTTPAALNRPGTLPVSRKIAARFAVGTARLLARLSPRHIRTVLTLLRHGATPATHLNAKAARDAVLAVSLACAGPQGCLPRSLATTLLCRMSGQWPVWCVGVRVLPPFGAHAWVEAQGRLVDEDVPDNYFRRLIAVPALEPKRS